MGRLGAQICVEEPSLVFTKRFAGIKIPLVRGANGHLLLDVCSDWTAGPKITNTFEGKTADITGDGLCVDQTECKEESKKWERKRSPKVRTQIGVGIGA